MRLLLDEMFLGDAARRLREDIAQRLAATSGPADGARLMATIGSATVPLTTGID